MVDEYIERIGEGYSFGLQFKYRVTIHNNGWNDQWVIYDMTDGKIIKKIEDKENPELTRLSAVSALEKINNISPITQDILDAMDTTP